MSRNPRPRNEDVLRLLDRLDLQAKPCFYSDVRVEETWLTRVAIRNGEVQVCELKPSLGAMIRVFNRGKWFYRATTDLQGLESQLDGLISQSLGFQETLSPGVAKRFGRDVKPFEETRFHHQNEFLPDTPLSEKLALAQRYEALSLKFPSVKDSQLVYSDMAKLKHFKSSRGVRYSYDYQQAGVNFRFTLKDEDHLFQDSLKAFSPTFDGLTALDERLSRQIRESHEFLRAPVIEPGPYRVVLDYPAVGVFAHESFGHKSEADFMLGDDHALSEWRIGTKVGSDVLSIVDDGNHPGTSGYCPWDDEGMPARKTYLIRNGKLTGRLHSQTTAMELDEEATGNGRAMNFEFEPIVRMTCTYLEPGDRTFPELIEQAGDGVLISDVRSGMGMSTFTMVPTRCYRIRGGKVAEPVRVNVASGSVFETLKEIEACSNEFHLDSSAIGGCGKGEQGPLSVAFGGPQVLVSRMNLS